MRNKLLKISGAGMLALAAASSSMIMTTPAAQAAEMPAHVITNVQITSKDTNQPETLEKIKADPTYHGDIKVVINFQVPDSAKVGDTYTFDFTRNTTDKEVSQLTDTDGNSSMELTMEGTKATLTVTESQKTDENGNTIEVCGRTGRFTLDGLAIGEPGEATDTDPNSATDAIPSEDLLLPQTTPLPEGTSFSDDPERCSDSEVIITETVTPDPTDDPSTTGEPTRPSTTESSTSSTTSTTTTTPSTTYPAANSPLPYYPDPTPSDVITPGSTNIGGGFTDDSENRNPKLVRSDGGESISVEDDEKVGPEVKTGGSVHQKSFWGKIAGLFT